MNNGNIKNVFDENYDMIDNNNNNSKISEINQTLIHLNQSKPIGIDFKAFINDIGNQTVHSISQSNDLPIIAEINDQHQNYKGILNKRVNCLKMIYQYWLASNINSALNALNIMKDISVTNDFLYSALVKNDISNLPLTLDNIIIILPLVNTLLEAKYDVYVKNGVKISVNILKCFSERIMSAKNVIVTNGVDLAREERLKKCDSIIEYFDKISKNSSIERILKKQNNDDVNFYLFSFIS